jgi:hypothetical protein
VNILGVNASVSNNQAKFEITSRTQGSQIAFSVTPRYEGCKFLSLNYNSLTKFNAGCIGSDSVLSTLIGDFKQADVFIRTKEINL